uniref:Uncharacterized protein n=1 Tax=Nothoprocta perdicaria TaxID=30464 RepID=A0A8C6Z7U8_NOTPE
MLEKNKIKCFSISMPKPIEHNSRNQGFNSKQDKSGCRSLNKKVQSFPLEFIERN